MNLRLSSVEVLNTVYFSTLSELFSQQMPFFSFLVYYIVSSLSNSSLTF